MNDSQPYMYMLEMFNIEPLPEKLYGDQIRLK